MAFIPVAFVWTCQTKRKLFLSVHWYNSIWLIFSFVSLESSLAVDIICLCICSYLSRLYLLLYLQFIHIGPLLITLQWLLILKKAIAVCWRIMWDGKGESNELWVFLPPLCFFLFFALGAHFPQFSGFKRSVSLTDVPLYP